MVTTETEPEKKLFHFEDKEFGDSRKKYQDNFRWGKIELISNFPCNYLPNDSEKKFFQGKKENDPRKESMSQAFILS